MNQLGDEGGRTYNRIPYADYTGYQPVNTAYKLKDPSRWQPNIVSAGNGIFQVQQFVTPQLRFTMPYSFDNKLESLGFSALFASQVYGLSLEGFVHYDRPPGVPLGIRLLLRCACPGEPAFPRIGRPRLRHLFRFISALVSTIMSVIFTKWSWDLCVYSVSVGEVTQAYPVSKVIFQSSFFVGGILMAIYFLLEAIDCLDDFRKKRTMAEAQTRQYGFLG